MTSLNEKEINLLITLESKYKNKTLKKSDLDNIQSKLFLQELATKVLGAPLLFSNRETIRVNILLEMENQ